MLGRLNEETPRKHALTERGTIVLADFANTTGDPVLTERSGKGWPCRLNSPRFCLVSEDRIQQVLRLMGKPSDARLTPEIAREICERTASAACRALSIRRYGLCTHRDFVDTEHCRMEGRLPRHMSSQPSWQIRRAE